MKTTEDLITEFYNQLSFEWYKEVEGYERAKIIPDKERMFNCDGYYHCGNAIYLYNIENEITVPNISALIKQCVPDAGEFEEEWETWKKLIVEEALHEYEFKIVHEHNNISEEAHRLCGLYSNRFYPPFKHRCDFFEAIVEKAEYFKLSPNNLVRNILDTRR
ncbi:MAG: hypothetical protein WCO97_12385 [bacterium]